VFLCLVISLFAVDAPASAPTATPKFDSKSVRAKALARATESDATKSKEAESTQTVGHGKKAAPPAHAPAPAKGVAKPVAQHAAPAAAHGAPKAANDQQSAKGHDPTATAHDKPAMGHGSSSHGKSPSHESAQASHGKKAAHKEPAPPPIPVCGEIPRSATWKKPRIVLERTLRIPAGKTLWIAAGTEILVGKRDRCQESPAPIEIIVEGRLVIAGNAWYPVRIAPEVGTKEWGGIRITGSAKIDHLRLSGANKGIWFHGSTGEVRSSLFEGCVTGVMASGGATPSLSHLVITRSQGAGLRVDRSSPSVTGTLFQENKGVAAWFAGTGLTRFENNAFWQNLQGDVVGTKKWGQFGGKAPLKSDASGNVQGEPVLVGTLRDNAWKDSLMRASRRPKDPPFGDPPWALSGASPLRGLGPRHPSKPWVKTDIGLYGMDIE
jgi:hypothetical protein